MKINGEFILREVVGEYILVPVGDTALHFSGIIGLNPVSAFIWQALQEGLEPPAILERLLEEFEVSREEAGQDLESFLNTLRAQKLRI